MALNVKSFRHSSLPSSAGCHGSVRIVSITSCSVPPRNASWSLAWPDRRIGLSSRVTSAPLALSLTLRPTYRGRSPRVRGQCTHEYRLVQDRGSPPQWLPESLLGRASSG